MKTIIIYLISVLFTINLKAQNPLYNNEKPVTINGYTLDAMEPHLSTDGNVIFFNSLNDGITTSLHYAGRVNDTVFNYIGLVPIVNQTITPRLDAVASIDTANNFYWISTRSWPSINENLERIRFLTSGYNNRGKVYGNFYINAPGWLIMDAAINYYGDKLIYCNALFSGCSGAPCKASMGVAQKINDSTFNKTPTSATLFASINDTSNYIVYAPFLTKDELELYYTRLLKGGTQTEVMVVTRSSTNAVFGAPTVLVTAPSVLPEACTLTSDKLKMYYHKYVSGKYELHLRYRVLNTDIHENASEALYTLFPNPTSNNLYITSHTVLNSVTIYNLLGEIVMKLKSNNAKEEIAMRDLPNGIYIISAHGYYSKVIKE